MIENDEAIYSQTSLRARFFQTVHAWPLSDELNYEGWLKNFKTGEEKSLACLMLDFFSYYPAKMIDQMLRTSVGKAGYYLSKHLNAWKHADFKHRCIYSFIPGEDPNPTDSGNYFTRKLRDALGIPETQIIDYTQIAEFLSGQTAETPVILVDDFVGSGAQVDKAWNYNKSPFNDKTLKEMAEIDKNIFIYAPLIVNWMGHERITKNCSSLVLSPCHILGPEYNIFDQRCFCWKDDPELYKKGTELILRKSKELGIPSTDGNDPQDEKGFGKQGLALAFEHGAPDAIPSFFYWQHENWTPLLKKYYVR